MGKLKSFFSWVLLACGMILGYGVMVVVFCNVVAYLFCLPMLYGYWGFLIWAVLCLAAVLALSNESINKWSREQWKDFWKQIWKNY